jgi:hypothetical protein
MMANNICSNRGGFMTKKMGKMDAFHLYWQDAEVEIIPAREPDRAIEWLKEQTPDTWHQVAMSWNYDSGYEVLTWIVNQENCDRGTAARIFNIEGVETWIWEILLAPFPEWQDDGLCSEIAKKWHSYKTGKFIHYPQGDIEDMLRRVVAADKTGIFENIPLAEILWFEGTRDAESRYASEDGRIVIDFDHWLKTKNITLV